MNLRNKTTLEFRTVFDSPLGVPNSQVSLYMYVGTFAVIRNCRFSTIQLYYFRCDLMLKRSTILPFPFSEPLSYVKGSKRINAGVLSTGVSVYKINATTCSFVTLLQPF